MKHLTILLSLLLLSSCGFSSVYGEHKTQYGQAYAVEDSLALILIQPIPDREGQYLHNALINRFYQKGYPSEVLYTLHTSPINERLINLDITVDSDSTRGQMILKTNITLKNLTTNELLLRRSLQAVTSYNILASQFTNRVSEQNARENALDDLARQIELQIGLHFRR